MMNPIKKLDATNDCFIRHGFKAHIQIEKTSGETTS